MPRLALVAVTLIALAFAAPASAKRVTGAKVCGATECRDVKDRKLLAALHDGGDPTDPPSNPTGGWYRATITVRGDGDSDRFTLAVLPEERYLRGYDEAQGGYVWMTMPAAAAKAYPAIVRGLAPRPVSSLRGLHQKPPRVRVVEVIEPPPETVPSGGFPWEWVAGGLGAAALAGAGLVTWRRRRGARLRRPGPQAAG